MCNKVVPENSGTLESVPYYNKNQRSVITQTW